MSWINPVNLREEENPEGSGKPENHVEREAIDRRVSKETCHDPMRHEPESTDQNPERSGYPEEGDYSRLWQTHLEDRLDPGVNG